jgi:hypothetical protein
MNPIFFLVDIIDADDLMLLRDAISPILHTHLRGWSVSRQAPNFDSMYPHYPAMLDITCLYPNAGNRYIKKQ